MYNHMKSPVFFFFLLWASSSLPAQCLTLTNCPVSPLTACDSTTNDVGFWNATTWLDPVTGAHDLVEGPTNLSIQIMDSCSGGVQVSYVLLLDLDGNGTRETAVASMALPAAGLVFYNNAFNPNYAGGEGRLFDQRPVTSDQKYGFALEEKIQNNLLTVGLRWANASNPGDYVLPQLPPGTHRIEWRVEKNGEIKTCAYDFVVKDCLPPSLACVNGLSVNIMPTMMIQLWATDFLQSAQDNISPFLQLEFGVRRAGTGTGFPLGPNGQPLKFILFTCADLGAQPVELWVRDAAGNTSSCETSILVQDNNGNCNGNMGSYEVCVQSPCLMDPEATIFEISSVSPAIPPVSIFFFGTQNPCRNFQLPPVSSGFKITPSNESNPLNAGVTTYDLILLSAHINGTQPFSHNEQWVAADTDLNGVIDTFDLINCRSLLLFGDQGDLDSVVYPGFRFYPANFVFPAGNPLALPIPNFVLLDSVPTNEPIVFTGVKTCDLNCFSSTGTEETGFSSLQIEQPRPNPTTAGVSITLSLQKPMELVVDILDVTGRLIYRTNTNLGAGEQQVEIPASAFPQAGLYLWRLLAGSEISTGKIIRQ